MTEKGIKAEQNTILRRVVMVFQPFLVYYIVNIITAVILTALVDIIIQDNHTAQAIGGTWKKILVEQKATVNAVIGGLSMLSGILPLFSTFRSEIMTNNNGCNLKRAKEEEDSNRYRTAAILKKTILTITLAFTSSIAINILFITLRLKAPKLIIRRRRINTALFFRQGFFYMELFLRLRKKSYSGELSITG